MGQLGACKLCRIEEGLRKDIENAMDKQRGGTLANARDLAASRGINLAQSVLTKHRLEHMDASATRDAPVDALPAIVDHAIVAPQDVLPAGMDFDDETLRKQVERAIERGIQAIDAGRVVVTARDTLAFMSFYSTRWGMKAAPNLMALAAKLTMPDGTTLQVGVSTSPGSNLTEEV